MCAAINAVTLALVDARISMKDMQCACSAGVGGESGDTAMVDLNRMELLSHGGDNAMYSPCAFMRQRETVILSQCQASLSLATCEGLLHIAIQGCEAVSEIMQASVREHVGILLDAHAGNVHALLYPSFNTRKRVILIWIYKDHCCKKYDYNQGHNQSMVTMNSIY